jgi:hypothetical protein
MSDDLPDDVAGRLAAESALRSFAGVGDRADSTDVPALEAPPPAKKTAKAKVRAFRRCFHAFDGSNL